MASVERGWQYPRVIAHRCGGALTPENTLAGLRIAARLGFRAVEFDVMLSADGMPLLIHDETLERTTDGSGEVAATPAAQLQALDAGGKHHRAFSGEPVPSFQQALEACLKFGLAANVEIKPAPGHEVATGQVVAQTVQRFLQQHRPGLGVPLLFSSFAETALAAAQAVAPQLEGITYALLVEEIPADWQARLRQLGCRGLHCSARELQSAQIAEVRAAGIPLACYTVNRPADAARLFAAGATTIFTDRLDLFDAAGNL